MDMIARNWRDLLRPRAVEVDRATMTASYGRFTCEPLERGFGTTLGNALRRTLLSSLEGAAITFVRLDADAFGLDRWPNLIEDVTDVLLNLKEVVVQVPAAALYAARLEKSGPSVVSAGDIRGGDDLRVLNPDHLIGILDREVTLCLDLTVEVGKGYVPAAANAERAAEVGAIPLDAAFSPVRKVNFAVTPARVGHSFEYDRLSLEIWTNGSVSPQAAARFAANVLREQFAAFIHFVEEEEPEPAFAPAALVEEGLFQTVEELELSVRAHNCLESANIRLIGELVQQSAPDLMKFRNFGRKSLREIQDKLAAMKLSLGMQIADWPAVLAHWKMRPSRD